MTAFPASAAPPPPKRPRAGPGEAVARLWSRTPLRIKLIASLIALVIAGLAATSITGAFVLRDYLANRANREVHSAFNKLKGPGDTISSSALHAEFAASGLGEFPFVTQLRNSKGQVETFNGPEQPKTGMPSIPTSRAWLASHTGQLVTVPAVRSPDKWRVITAQVTVPNQDVFGQPYQVIDTLVVGADLGDVSQTIARLVSIDLIVGAIVVAGLAIIGIAVVRASLRPLAEMEHTAGEIAGGDLSKRVPVLDPRTEVGSLGRSLNAMLAQIEAAFRAQERSEAAARSSEGRMRRFAADASHELRTPLTAIKGFAEYYRQRGGLAANGAGQLTREELDHIMHRVESEATRMGVLVEDLLLLARIDQQRPLDRTQVDMLALAADAVQDARMIDPARDVRLVVGRHAAFLVIGDEARLRQVIGNLMSNALAHTPEGTPIELRVGSGTIDRGSQPVPAVIVEVTDHGPGLTAEQAGRVFERFYRADQARTRTTGGAGLGLAIVSALVAAHGGQVSVRSEPGEGATFRVALPLAPEAQAASEDDARANGSDGPPPPDGSPALPAEASGTEPGTAPGRVLPGGQAGPPGKRPDTVEQRSWRPFS